MKKRVIRLTETDLHGIIKKSVNRVLKESVAGVMDEWYSEEDYDGNTGEPGMVRSYETGSLYIGNFEQMAEEEGYNSWEDALGDWWSEVRYDTPWYWYPESSCKGGETILTIEADDIQELPGGQIVITQFNP